MALGVVESCQGTREGGTFKESFSTASSSVRLFTLSRSASSFPFWREECGVTFTSAKGDANAHSRPLLTPDVHQSSR